MIATDGAHDSVSSVKHRVGAKARCCHDFLYFIQIFRDMKSHQIFGGHQEANRHRLRQQTRRRIGRIRRAQHRHAIRFAQFLHALGQLGIVGQNQDRSAYANAFFLRFWAIPHHYNIIFRNDFVDMIHGVDMDGSAALPRLLRPIDDLPR